MKVKRLALASVILTILSQCINPPAAWSQAAADLGRSTGSPNAIYHGTDLENVDTMNGALQITLPLLHLPGRGLDTDVALSYNSKIFQTIYIPTDGRILPQAVTGLDQDISALGSLSGGGGFGSPGWSLGVPRMGFVIPGAAECLNTDPNGNCVYEIAHETFLRNDGTRLALVNENPNGVPSWPPLWSFDGSFALATDRGILYKDGVVAKSSQQDLVGITEEILTDTNGNFIRCSFAGGNPFPNATGCSDTVGRSITYTPDPVTGLPGTITYMDSSGISRSIHLQYEPFALNYPFADSTACNVRGYLGQPTTWLLTSVILANNLRYSFQYFTNPDGSTTGEIKQIILPTGGYVRYDYGFGNASTDGRLNSCTFQGNAQNRIVTHRFVSPDGTPGSEQVWSYALTQLNDVALSQVMTVTDPLGNSQVYFRAFGSPLPYQTDFKDASGTTLKSVRGEMESSPDSIKYFYTSAWYANARYKSLTTILPDANQQSKVTLTYGPFNNVTEKDETDWGVGAPGPVIRKTTFTYLNDSNPAYAADTVHILDRATSQTICDAANTFCSQTATSYDTGTLTQTTNIVQHDYANFSAANTLRGNLIQISRFLNTTGGSVVTTNAYNDVGNLIQVTDPNNNVTSFSYDDNFANGTPAQPTAAYPTRITHPVTSGINHIQRFQYYFNTGLTAASCGENFPAGTACTSGLTGAPDYKSISYDSMGRPLTVTSGDGGQTTYTYNEAALPINIASSTKMDASHDLTQTTAYDGLGRVLQTQLTSDPSGTTYQLTTYDALGRKDRVYNPTRCNPPDTNCGEPTWGYTSFTYDGLNRTTVVKAQDGGTTSSTFTGNTVTVVDPAGKRRRSITDGLGRLAEVDEPGAPFAGIVSSGTLTINGTLRSAGTSTSGSGTVTITGTELTYIDYSNCTFDSIGMQICPLALDTGGIALSVGTTQKTAYFGPNSDAASIALDLATQLNSDAASLVTANVSGAILSLTARAAGSATNYTLSVSCFSLAGSFCATLSGTTLTGGSDSGPIITDSGTVTVTIGGFSASAPYGQASNSTGAAVAAALIGTGPTGLNGSGSPVTATASGATLTITDKNPGTAGNGSVTAASSPNDPGHFPGGSFSGSGLLSGGLDPTGPSLDHNFYVTRYQYDVLGNLLRVDQQGSAPSDSSQWRTRLFTYDSLSRLTIAQNPESGKICYGVWSGTTCINGYDADGNLLMKTSPAPNQPIGSAATQTISYCYDELHRITKKDYQPHTYSLPACPITAPVVSYTYDQGLNGIGHLTGLTDQAGTASYSYDAMGRISSETRVISGVSKSMSYDYNLDGSLWKLHYPSNAVVTYTPDSAGHMLSAVDSGNGINYATSATYQPDGQITGFLSGQSATFAGITNSFSYNKRLQPINMSASAPSQTVFSLGYDFDLGNGNNGNVYGITNYKDANRSQTFTYDALNRLTTAQSTGTSCSTPTLHPPQTQNWGNSYVYDAWGNLLQKNVTKCWSEPLSVTVGANNQITDAGYSYDAAGNLTSDATDGVAATYDAENRISLATKNGISTSYTYDSDGNRVVKVTPPPPAQPASGTIYWYMAPGIVAESDLNGVMQSEYLFFNGQRIARRDNPSGSPSPVFYYFSDHLKTTDVVTDASGNTLNESDFYPWGGELQFLASDPNNHYKFTGKERDETGLDYFGARYYSNGLGRFITPDWSKTPVPVPYADLNDPQTLCQYCYVRGLPTTKADADGHGLFTKLKNWFTDGGFNEDAEAQQERARRQHQRAEDARKTLSGMKGFTINGQTPADFAKGANDQQALAGLNAATNFVFGEAQKHFMCPGAPEASCGVAFPTGGMGAAALEEGAASEYINITRGGSVTNIKTNVTASEFGANLEANGFVKSTAADGTLTYTKGSTQYTVYSSSHSTGGPTAQIKINGEVVGKIRLQ